jgi:hypothetical protein
VKFNVAVVSTTLVADVDDKVGTVVSAAIAVNTAVFAVAAFPAASETCM